MKKIIFVFMLALFPMSGMASGGAGVHLDYMKTDHNEESLQRGAKYFANYCMGCHSLKYMRYERIADDLSIPHELMQEHLNFSGRKIGSLMTIAAPEEAQKRWFGAVPPDLSLITRARGGADWLYTYMRTFYKDENRPYGVNNKVFPDVGMPHVMLELQGVQECEKHKDENGHVTVGECDITEPGLMSKKEYDQAVFDLVNFLAYAAEPYKADSHRIGVKVLLYVLLFLFCAILLNREYWKEIH
ncbi:MAG: cytochrome c1 [Pseudomonadales bacterium]|nr:cytochrome c1 [Pseudomonadales bacterium]